MRGVEGVGLFEDEHWSGLCGAQCMRVRVCVFMICCEILTILNLIPIPMYVRTVLYMYVRICVCVCVCVCVCLHVCVHICVRII